MPTQAAISNFHQHVLDTVASANELAFNLPPTVEGLTLRSNILVATIQLGSLVGPRSENEACGPFNLPGQEVACWADSCLEWGRADGGLLDRLRFNQACAGWASEVDNWLVELSNLVSQIDPAQAEVIESVRDEGQTIQQEASEVVPTAGEVLQETPAALKLVAVLALGFLVFREVG